LFSLVCLKLVNPLKSLDFGGRKAEAVRSPAITVQVATSMAAVTLAMADSVMEADRIAASQSSGSVPDRW